MSRPDIVLLHGWGFNRLIWQDFLPLLEPYYTVHCLDLPGFGKNTTIPNPYDLTALMDNIVAQAPEKAIYVGWSLGGLVALMIAIHHAHRITRLVNIASSPCFLQQEQWPGIKIEVLEKFSAELNLDYVKTIKRFLLLQFYHASVPSGMIKKLIQQVLSAPKPSSQTLNGGLKILKQTDLRPLLKKITCPQHYLFGQLDTLAPAKLLEPFKKFHPSAQYTVIEGAAHAPFLSHPHICLEAIQHV